MRQGGYSDRSAEKPQELTKSKGWQELMTESLPDEKLLQVHLGLLDNPDWRARANGLDKAYKLRDLYKSSVLHNGFLEGLSLEELDEKLAELEPILERAKLYRKRKTTT